ncbi:Uncharacterised protein [Zhongshania aliphaticivorans]|uniref:Uncharacterized protein n=1 Tax=Zhongshania aliphaticivorans TaxID=1470434 RepID=A0A5S9PM69_9GAMM|nr:hypothetical protein [Zhongshania aliphaticivorans]CAA0105184.1 Uncharacterised protein [Zhongshania aliphaticivorans]CAA0105464.1 Uncharacterised protein [Zhongshania aliphaticivorans]
MISSPEFAHKRLHALLILLLAFITVACSQRQIYEASHANRLQECEKLLPAQYQACVDEYGESYDDYQRRKTDK